MKRLKITTHTLHLNEKHQLPLNFNVNRHFCTKNTFLCADCPHTRGFAVSEQAAITSASQPYKVTVDLKTVTVVLMMGDMTIGALFESIHLLVTGDAPYLAHFQIRMNGLL